MCVQSPVTHCLAVVHDAVVVVGDVVVLDDSPRILLEVEVHAGRDVAADDSHVAVTVGPRLLVVQTQRVAHLVDDDLLLQPRDHRETYVDRQSQET